MADPQQYTEAQLSDGTTLRFLGELNPDQVRDKVSAFRLKRPDLSAPPAIQPPKVDVQPGPEGLEADPNNPNHNPYAGVPGAQPMNRPVQGKDLIPGAAVAAPAAAYMGGSVALPFLGAAAKTVGPALKAGAKAGAGYAATEAIVQGAKKLPLVGDTISKIPGLDYLPFLVGSVSGHGEEGKPSQKVGTPPVRWNAGEGPKPGAPTPPVRWNPPAEPGPEVPQRPIPPPSRAALGRQLDQPLRESVGAPPAPQPGMPVGMTPVKSSALKGYRYDPGAQEMHVMTNDGTTYVHGDVAPEQAQAFQTAPSKGQAWQDIRNNSTLVRKVPPGGKGINVKPAMKLRSASPDDEPPSNDLTDLLTRSVQAAKAKK